MKKWVYLFDEVKAVEKLAGGSWDGVKAIVGGKGAGLLDLTRASVPIPPFFTVITKACNAYQKTEKFPAGMWEQELKALKVIEKATGKKFGDAKNPLLVSCRSGAKFSMPGMMNTILNLGLNDAVAEGLAEATKNPRFAYDSYRRLLEMFGTVVMDIADEAFEHPMHEYKAEKGYKLDTEMTAEDWKAVVELFKAAYKKATGDDFPQDPYKQLSLATEAVFRSWNGKRAVDYRNKEKISHTLGTAVNICTMVFGNMGDDSATGVAFTRNPSTGDALMMGEYLINAQGEDVVAGIRNADPIAHLNDQMPAAYKQFMNIVTKLEKHYKDMQDFEFTIEHGQPWILQTRDGKRTAKAAIKIAVDMADEGLITREEAIMRVTPENVDAALAPQLRLNNDTIDYSYEKCIATGLGVSSGIATGKVYFDADNAERAAGEYGEDTILIRPFCKAEDIHGMLASKGIISIEGGTTSQAALVARQFNIPCIIGVNELQIDSNNRRMIIGAGLSLIRA